MPTAMIFAAGLGTRLRPLTDNMPKALVQAGGRPLIRIISDKLVSCGYDDIVVNVHHFADMVEDYLRTLHYPGVRIRVSDERDFLRDTGGGIRHAGKFLAGSGHFLVHNVDILSNIDLVSFEASVRPDALATLSVSDRKTSRYLLFDDGMRLVGWTNLSTGEVRSQYPDVEPGNCRKYAFSGIHIISDEVFSLFGEKGFGEKFSIIDFYLKMAAERPVYGYVQDGLEVLDVGKPEQLAAASGFMASHSM